MDEFEKMDTADNEERQILIDVLTLSDIAEITTNFNGHAFLKQILLNGHRGYLKLSTVDLRELAALRGYRAKLDRASDGKWLKVQP